MIQSLDAKPQIYDGIIVQKSDEEEKFMNFTKIIINISAIKDNTNNTLHTVNVYRFWAYGSRVNVPVDTGYFLKLIQHINMNNPPVQVESKDKKIVYDPKKSMVNYIFHSE